MQAICHLRNTDDGRLLTPIVRHVKIQVVNQQV